ncbi:MAG: hypothetical protein KDK05_27915 [Candidatus Competibacteraceae bacterium]|nr:hypothetical protein [Candidatus Competibacteraceae bacterium]
MSKLKAWHCSADDFCGEASLLVFAETRNRARLLAFSTHWDCADYIYMQARRAAEWDAWADQERVVEDNSELPEGAPAFYWDDPDCMRAI